MRLLIDLNNRIIIKPDIARFGKDTNAPLKVEEVEPIQLSDHISKSEIPDSMIVKTRYFRWVVSYRDWSIWFED